MDYGSWSKRVLSNDSVSESVDSGLLFVQCGMGVPFCAERRNKCAVICTGRNVARSYWYYLTAGTDRPEA